MTLQAMASTAGLISVAAADCIYHSSMRKAGDCTSFMHLTPVVPRVRATTPASFILAPLFVSVSCQYGMVSCTSWEDSVQDPPIAVMRYTMARCHA
jgi:hypothetical protein